MKNDEKPQWQDDEVSEILREQEKRKDKPGKTNTDGVKRINRGPERVIDATKLANLVLEAETTFIPPKGIAAAFGIKFLTNEEIFKFRMTVQEVMAKDALKPIEYHNPEDFEVILVNEIVRLSPEAAAYLQITEGVIGEAFFRIPPGEWQLLPHRFYIPFRKGGGPIRAVGNSGKEKFIGNKRPSRPGEH